MLLPGAFLTKENEKTFQYDNSLPSLPVPTLEHTLHRYLDSGERGHTATPYS